MPNPHKSSQDPPTVGQKLDRSPLLQILNGQSSQTLERHASELQIQ